MGFVGKSWSERGGRFSVFKSEMIPSVSIAYSIASAVDPTASTTNPSIKNSTTPTHPLRILLPKLPPHPLKQNRTLPPQLPLPIPSPGASFRHRPPEFFSFLAFLRALASSFLACLAAGLCFCLALLCVRVGFCEGLGFWVAWTGFIFEIAVACARVLFAFCLNFFCFSWFLYQGLTVGMGGCGWFCSFIA